MRLRDRLSSLSSPSSPPAPARMPATSAVGPAPEGAFERSGRGVAAPRDDVALRPASELGAFERSERIAQLRALIERVEARPRSSGVARRAPAENGLCALLGEPSQTPHGALHRRERWLDPQHCHGRVTVRAALQAEPATLARLALDPGVAELDVSRLLVIDTETTGLAGGTGTVPFLIGLGWFEQGAFKLEQLMLSNFGAERPMLARLAERLAQASCIVTYNGKSFDWPLLRSRFILNRVPCPQLPAHIDLLHCGRRVFKGRLPSLRLGELERSVLHFHRDDDIDGAEIPGRYLGYLRSGDARLLEPVLEHNQHDVIALPAILWRLCAHFEQVRPGDDARDQFAYARLALRSGDLERAVAFGRSAAECAELSALRSEALALCAEVAQRRGEQEAAAALWQDALEAAPCVQSRARLHLVLCRHYERRLKDLQRACDHAHFTAPAEGESAHERRLQRLLRRLARAAEAAVKVGRRKRVATGGRETPCGDPAVSSRREGKRDAQSTIAAFA